MFELNEKNKKDYSIINKYVVEEQNILLVELSHNKTKAKLLLFICDDDNRVFNIAFKTPVFNGKGTPHILEHSVLCGSKKYNVKDPFIELAKGSMNTFLNAMTFSDKTCYPVASANLTDFHNLMSVYLDAVFYPNAIFNDKIFKQEGWHYELEDKNAELTVNGVVYNEMKGVYSDPDSIMDTAILSNLYKDTNYAYEYGGDPDEIINLTYDEFVNFHKKYYSATNSIISLYGNLDYNFELSDLQEKYLKDLEYEDINIEFLDSKQIEEDIEKTDYYNIDGNDFEDKYYIAYSFSMDEKKDNYKNLIMLIIDYLLFASESAILREKFLNEKYAETIVSHYDSGIKNSLYSIILQNTSINKKDKFKEEFYNEINNILKNGIDENKIKAAINSLYFKYAEDEYGRVPRGLCLILQSLDSYLYDQDPSIYIKYKDDFDRIMNLDLSSLENDIYKIINEVFLLNKHKCINILEPKVGYLAEKEEKLKEKLGSIKQKMSDSEINDLISDMKELKKYQQEIDTKVKLKCIPRLKTSDIDKTKNVIDYKHEQICNTDTIITTKNDKDIVYMSLYFDVTNFSKEEIYFMALIKSLISKIDFKNLSYKEFDNLVDINTGGVGVGITIYENKAFFSFEIKSKIDKLNFDFDIFKILINDVIFSDTNRIKILLTECKACSLVDIQSKGHLATCMRAKSKISFSDNFLEKCDSAGIAYYKFLNKILEIYDDDSLSFNSILDLLYKKIVSQKMYFNVCSNEKYLSKIKDSFIGFKSNINSENSGKSIDEKLGSLISKCKDKIDFDSFESKSDREAIITTNDINFCSVASEYDSYSGEFNVLKTLFNYEYLWTNIRVLGGAYGCMSFFGRNGVYAFSSYRDPNLSKTNKTFYGIYNYLENLKLDDEDVEKCIIGSIGSVDNPLSIVDNHKRNIGAFYNNLTNELYNKYRSDILNMKSKDFNKLSKCFSNISNAKKCALICEKSIEEAKKEYDVIWKLAD